MMEEDAIVSFDDDDDEFADLFSFVTAPSESRSSVKEPSSPRKTPTSDYSDAMSSVMPLPPTFDNDSEGSDDSLLELLEQQKDPVAVVDAAAARSTHSQSKTTSNADEEEESDARMQEILDWLDDQDDESGEAERQPSEEDNDDEDLLPPSMRPPPPPELPEPEPEPEPQFETLEEAVRSPKSSLTQIRTLLHKEGFQLSASVRPHLWCRVVCGKTLEETLQSSVADSFQQWEQHNQSLLQGKDTVEISNSSGEGTVATASPAEESTTSVEAKDEGEAVENIDLNEENSSQPTTTKTLTHYQKAQRAWIQEQSSVLADRIVMVLGGKKSESEQALTALLLNHYHTGQKQMDEDDIALSSSATSNHKGETSTTTPTPPAYQDPLLPPVACAILAAGVPKSAAAVMLSQIVPHFMPILALTTKERENAAQLLYRQFYFLASYHLPLLVLHLDRYLPNWFMWPNFSTNKKDGQGFVPQSYLISHLAGECAVAVTNEKDSGSQLLMMNPRWILALWDLILASSNNSLRFFLVLAVLDSQADQLVLLTDDALKEKLTKVLRFQHEDSSDSFVAQGSDEQTTDQDATKWVQKWTDRAQTIWEQTPVSISRRLKRVEDQAVTETLTNRQQEAEERLKRKLEAQAKAHQEAMEAERERKGDEARLRLTRARLVAFYRQHNPGKETNIEKIMETYQGRYEVLDAKLKQKYGVGFNPAVKPKPAPARNANTSNPSNQSLSGKTHKGEVTEDEIAQKRRRNQLVVRVAPSEVLPVVCWSKKANKVRLFKLEKGNKLEENAETRLPLKFFLVDSRPVATAQDQGRFPTAVSFPPEDLRDPDRMKQQEEKLEALRGASHIVIMGEGFAALPGLYGHKMTAGLAECIREDDARNHNCALFFLKNGFPFVSTLDGGFAGAHAFLCREGKKHHLRVNDVLSDYNPEASIFGQFERIHTSTGREKAQRALQSIFDSSIVALTKNTRRFETNGSEVNTDERNSNIRANMVSRFFASGGPEQVPEASVPENDSTGGTTGPVFRNPFARATQPQTSSAGSKQMSRENSNASLDVESVHDLDADDSLGKEAKANDGPDEADAPVKQGSEPTSSNVPKPPAAQPLPKEAPKVNPFAGFGAAFNSSLKAASKAATGDAGNAANKSRGITMFARFNQQGRNMDKSQHGMGSSQHGLGSSQHGKKAENQGSSINFAGFSQFRMNTFNRMKSTGDYASNSVKTEEQEDTVKVESESFDQTASAAALTEPEQVSATAEEEHSTVAVNDTSAIAAETAKTNNTPPSDTAPTAGKDAASKEDNKSEEGSSPQASIARV